MSSEIAALEELKGRCRAINIEYPDTGIRMRPAMELIEKSMHESVKRPLTQKEVDELAEELYDLRAYLSDIMKEHPVVTGEFKPTIAVINYLLGSE